VKQLVVASTNPGKVREIRLALKDLSEWSVEPLPAGIADPLETGTSFAENAALKAIHYSRCVDGFVLADDSGLCVEALDSRPGLYSARYASTPEESNRRLLDELDALGPGASRDATFFCALALSQAGTVVWAVERTLRGRIVHHAVGALGFGYDPIFLVPELGKTLAELTTEEKNRVSARGQALAELRRFLKDPDGR